MGNAQGLCGQGLVSLKLIEGLEDDRPFGILHVLRQAERLLGFNVSCRDEPEEETLKKVAELMSKWGGEAAVDKRIYMAGSYPDPSLLEVARNTRSFMTLLQVIPGRSLEGMEECVVEFGLASGAEIIVPGTTIP